MGETLENNEIWWIIRNFLCCFFFMEGGGLLKLLNLYFIMNISFILSGYRESIGEKNLYSLLYIS